MSSLLDKIKYKKDRPISEVMAGFNETAVDTQGMGFGIVVDENGSCIGVVTDGAIRRCLSKGVSINAPIKEVMNSQFSFVKPDATTHQILRIFDNRIKHIPVIGADETLQGLIQFNEFNASARMEEHVIRARVPLRISFAGGGTDLSCYFSNQNGYVLTSTMNKYCYATVKVRSDKKIRLLSKDYNQQIIVDSYRDLTKEEPLTLIKACVRLMEPEFGFDLETYSEIEPGTGLGGSSAMSVAIIGALNHFRNENHLDQYALADLAYQAERIELGIAGGWQDQYATTFGGLNLLEFRKNEIVVIPLKVSNDIILELHFNLLLFRFGEARKSGAIHEDQRQQLNANPSLKIHYEKLARLTLSVRDTLLKGQLQKFGNLLHEGWELKKNFSKKISNNKIDIMYQSAINAGASGGKVLGAGRGGYLLIYCNPSHQPQVIESLSEKGARLENFDFVDAGLQTWTARH